MPELKSITYKGFRGADGEVLYVIADGRCTYCGITPGSTSTINAAERVISAIVNAEGLFPSDVEFYDIQTRAQYEYKKPGSYDFTRVIPVVVDGEIRDATFLNADCPDQIKRLFENQIFNR
jgi:hypothetical protein